MADGADEIERLDIAPVHGRGALDVARFGARGAALRTLAQAGLSTAPGLALSAAWVARFDPEHPDPAFQQALAGLKTETDTPLALRPSPAERRSGEGPAILHLSDLEEIAAAIVKARDVFASLSARMLRMAKGLPETEGLAMILQPVAAQSDRVWFRRPADGWPEIKLQHGRLPVSSVPADLGMRLEAEFGMAVEAQIAASADGLVLLDAYPAVFSARATLKTAVDLAERGVIGRDEAILRVDAATLDAELLPRIASGWSGETLGVGLAASPGAAAGPLVFTAVDAERAAAQGVPAILARVETGPEDIRGMHAAAGVLTMKGGLTSHAAVVARGLGKPCVVSPEGLMIDRDDHALILPGGRRLTDGADLTIDGNAGAVFAGAADLSAPRPSAAFEMLMDWADKARRLRVRANADTAEEATMARHYGAEGIGLCRTEHMFFAAGRQRVMRGMILSESAADREAALARLLEWQRADFAELFEIMRGLPVTIRLLDPPLHEFLPSRPKAVKALADELGLDRKAVKRRVEELSEYNPMLGMRGCRVGVTQPDIYAMQTRAILEAAAQAATVTGEPVIPEIMIPLVATLREMELLKAVIDGAAAAVRDEFGTAVSYKIGAMVETPRAAVRAGPIASTAEFLSFGTNDLTQMTYGLSRDDAGRFMREYVRLGVFPEDPFQTLDVEGVGELLRGAAKQARATRAEATLGICGEHGGDAASILFFEEVGFDYVSCSPYRAPAARLAAAQARIRTG